MQPENEFDEDLPAEEDIGAIENIESLKESRGNRAKAARTLGISERIMGLRVNKYGIESKQFRSSETD